jgi:hypothetical protein
VPCNYKLIYESLLGGWIHRDAYGGKYLLQFKDVADKLMIRFASCYARSLMDPDELLATRGKDLISDRTDQNYNDSDRLLYNNFDQHLVKENVLFSYQPYDHEIQLYCYRLDPAFVPLGFVPLENCLPGDQHPDDSADNTKVRFDAKWTAANHREDSIRDFYRAYLCALAQGHFSETETFKKDCREKMKRALEDSGINMPMDYHRW